VDDEDGVGVGDVELVPGTGAVGCDDEGALDEVVGGVDGFSVGAGLGLGIGDGTGDGTGAGIAVTV
jgi:hypothetical protein